MHAIKGLFNVFTSFCKGTGFCQARSDRSLPKQHNTTHPVSHQAKVVTAYISKNNIIPGLYYSLGDKLYLVKQSPSPEGFWVSPGHSFNGILRPPKVIPKNNLTAGEADNATQQPMRTQATGASVSGTLHASVRQNSLQI